VSSFYSHTILWSEEGSVCTWDKSNSVICTLFKITFLGKWDKSGERPFLELATSQFSRSPHTFCAFCPVESLLSCFEQFCWRLITTYGTSNLWTKLWMLLLPIFSFNSFLLLHHGQGHFTTPEKEMDIWWDFRSNRGKEGSKRQRKEPISRSKGWGSEKAQSGSTAAAARHVHEIKYSELKRKFQIALLDSQINDSQDPATSAMYAVSDWRKFD